MVVLSMATHFLTQSYYLKLLTVHERSLQTACELSENGETTKLEYALKEYRKAWLIEKRDAPIYDFWQALNQDP